MNENTYRFVCEKFTEYYKNCEIEPPTDFLNREWGNIFFGIYPNRMFMKRHISFINKQELKNHLIEASPAHVYFSAAIYQYPSAIMADKEWLGCDLIFDIDAKNINNAKEEIWKLIECLSDDFGFSTKSLKINFSGARGFHIRIEEDKIRDLGTRERREIVDWIKAKGCEIDAPVTSDIKRIIRFQNSIHGRTGFITKPLSLSQLESFDPFYHAVAFSNTSIEIEATRDFSIIAKDKPYDVEEGEVVSVPEYFGIYCMCQEIAECYPKG